MMREVFDYCDAADLRAHFQPPLHALKGCESLSNYLFADALTKGQRVGSGCVQSIVLAGQLHLQLCPQCALVPEFPAGEAAFMPQVTDAPLGLCAEAVTLHAAESVAYTLAYVFAAVIGHDYSPPGHQVHQALECGFHRLKIGVDIG